MPPATAAPRSPEGPRQGDARPAIEDLRARIREQSKAVADRIAADPAAKAFIDDLVAPSPLKW